jgi:hypothetical protein
MRLTGDEVVFTYRGTKRAQKIAISSPMCSNVFRQIHISWSIAGRSFLQKESGVTNCPLFLFFSVGHGAGEWKLTEPGGRLCSGQYESA